MKTSLTNNNFSTGIVNSSINGRYDLSIYKNGLEICENFIVNYEGGLKNRTGTIKLLNTVESFFIPFFVTREQSYLIQFTIDNKIRFLTYSSSGNFGYIKNEDDEIYEINSPYLFKDTKKIQYAQKQDVLYLCHEDYKVHKLSRLTQTTFSIEELNLDIFNENTGFPSAVCFYENRLFYAGLKKESTFIYASDVGYYDTFTLTGGSDDDLDGFKFDLVEINKKIDWLQPTQNTLICGASDGLLYCNGGSSLVAMTKKNFQSRKASTNGTIGTKPILIENISLYIDETGRNTRSFIYDLISENFQTQNLNIVNNDFTLSGIKQLVSLKKKDLSVYVLLNNGNVLFCNFLKNEEINCWTCLKFKGNIKQIINIPRGYDSFEDLLFLIEDDGLYFISKLSDEIEIDKKENFFTGDKKLDFLTYQRYLSEISKHFIYLDECISIKDEYNSTITFDEETKNIISTNEDFNILDVGKRIIYKSLDGKDYSCFEIKEFINNYTVKVENIRFDGYSQKTFSSWYKTFSNVTISDSFYFGKTVDVVGDGGYIGKYNIDNQGNIEFNKQLTVVNIGFSYKSIAKTLNLGFDINGSNTQIANKNITKINIRLNNSAGGLIGTDRYNLQKIQDFNPNGFYDNIPLLMNGDKEISIEDNWDKEKNVYLAQNEPLPININMITITREDNLL